MEAKLDVLSDALLNYKANIDEKDCGIYKEITEKKIAEMENKIAENKAKYTKNIALLDSFNRGTDSPY